MEPFEFKNTHTHTEEEYEDIHRLYTRKQKRTRKVILAFVAVACYFSAYTLLLGIVLTLFLILGIFTKKITKFARTNNYKESKLLKKELTYGLTESHLTVEGQGVFVRIRWSMIKVWQLHDKWLRIGCDQLPAFYFEIEKLKERDLLDRVLSLCNKHGVMFDSKENKERYNQAAHTTPAIAPR
ncbi:hypothetical protein [Pelagicoccus sp. SDUM812003]|uniref:hypothetical protein n=1 Tax=Pelagicoccus sp. SDUM812003 TaxID=3041267 RepID=UPI00280FEA48|nr:hypothetical protein [Pelagicoccus sp. SDUM812003]MDQ8205804.1 hypothetical protein [Pelagicoccus sp. SDUM812003]